MAGKTAAEFLAPFLSKWGEDAYWTPAGNGSGATVRVLLTNNQSAVRFGMVAANEPEIMFRAGDCPALTNGDDIVIAGETYRVRDGGDFKDATARRFKVRKS